MKKIILFMFMIFSITNINAQNFKIKSNKMKIDVNTGLDTGKDMFIDGNGYYIYSVDSIEYIKCTDLNHIEYAFWIGKKTDCDFIGSPVYSDFEGKYFCIFKISKLNNQPYVMCLNKLNGDCNFEFNADSGDVTGKQITVENKQFYLYVIDDLEYIKCIDENGKKYPLFIGFKTDKKFGNYDVYSNRPKTKFWIFKLDEKGNPYVEPYNQN